MNYGHKYLRGSAARYERPTSMDNKVVYLSLICGGKVHGAKKWLKRMQVKEK